MFTDILSEKEIEYDKELSESPLLDEFKKIWEIEEVEIIFKTLKYIDKVDDENKKVYLKIIDDIISLKEQKVNEFINKYSTSYN